ncbi:hypothetical protein OUE_1119 [Helicobacter pylori R030b]|nr:hypothetical protein OUE_1119 [Helicobacter pylori R030b]
MIFNLSLISQSAFQSLSFDFSNFLILLYRLRYNELILYF